MCKMQEALAQGIVGGCGGGDCKAFGNGREGRDKNLMQKYLALKVSSHAGQSKDLLKYKNCQKMKKKF